MVYRGLGIRACLELNPFRSIQLGSRPTYPLKVSSHSVVESIDKRELRSHLDYRRQRSID